jgi:hypothetical protein
MRLTSTAAPGLSAYEVCEACFGVGFKSELSYAGISCGEMVPAPPMFLPHSQSRRKSLVETVTSTTIGFAVALVLTAIVMPAFGYPTTWAHDFWITSIFTVASIARGYCVRRMFEAWR